MPPTSAEQPRFLGAFDTVERRKRHIPRSAAELQLSLLFGQRVLLSQTQAFDGTHFLEIAAGEQGDSFLKLIETGHVLIHLQPDGDPTQPPSLCKLLAAKTAQAEFHLSGWPEVPQPHRDSPKPDLEDRERHARIFAEAACGGEHHLRELGDTVAARWQVLRRVDECLKLTPVEKRHDVSRAAKGRSLDEEIKELTQTPFVSAAVRRRLLDSAEKGTNARSCYHKDIAHNEGLNPTEQQEAHQLVNGEYNRVVARSLDASANLVTTTRDAAHALCETAEGEHPTERGIEEAPEYADQVEGISWDTLGTVLSHLRDTSHSPRYRADFLKERVRIAAKEVTEYAGKRKIMIVLGNVLAPGLTGIVADGVVKGVGAAIAHNVPFAFTIPSDIRSLSEPMMLAIVFYLTGRELGIKSLVKEYLNKGAVDRHTGEIINIVKQHPGAQHLPLT